VTPKLFALLALTIVPAVPAMGCDKKGPDKQQVAAAGPDAGATAPDKTAEAKPDPTPAEAKPAEAKADPKPAEAKADPKPAEPKPAEAKAEPKPVEAKAEPKPAEAKAEPKPAQPKTAGAPKKAGTGLTACGRMFHVSTSKAAAKPVAAFADIPKLLDPKSPPPLKDLCMDTKVPCGPDAAASVVSYGDIGSEAIIVKRVGAAGYWLMKEPWNTNMVAVDHTVTELGDLVHVGVSVPLYERVPFCETEEDEEDGNCTTATALVGSENTDYVIDPKTGKLLWQAYCELGEQDKEQPVKVARKGDRFSYTPCKKGAKPAIFTLAHLSTCPSPKDNMKAEARRLINLGRKATKKGDFKAAIAHYDGALKLDAESTSAMAERGYAHLKAGRLKDAETDFDMAIETAAPTKKKFLGAVFFNLGLVAEARKDTKAAKEAYKRSLEYRPSTYVQKKFDALK